MKNKIWKKAARLIAAVLFLTVAVSAGGMQGPDGRPVALAAPGSAKTGQSTQGGDTSDGSQAEVHFIDVGQGDATLIKCGGHAMLIDAGDNDKGMAVQMYLKKQGVEKLDYLVLTHPDADHIGGADVVITKFTVGRVFMSDYEKDNKTYREVIQALDDKKLKWSTPKPGTSYSLGAAKFTILAPVESYEDPNNSSVALLFQNGENRFLFTGDAQEEAEQDILDSGRFVKADVYKVGHHGSDTSSGQDFLDAVSPKWAVISCEEGNSYGHPHAAVLNSLRAMGVEVFRTDEQGSIIAWSDGKKITWNSAPSDTWQAGERTGSAAQNAKNSQKSGAETKGAYIGNANNGKLHRATCSKLPQEKNRVPFDTKEEAMQAGYDDLCKLCKP